MKPRSWLAILIMLVLHQPLILSALPSPTSIKVEVFSDGWSYVEARYEVSEPGRSLQISIPVSHYEDLMVVDDKNLLLNFSMSGDRICVQTDSSTKYVIVMYQTPSLTHKDGIVWNLTIGFSAPTVKVTLPKGAVVVGMSGSPSSLNTADGMTVLTFSGASWIAYVLPPPVNLTKPSIKKGLPHPSPGQHLTNGGLFALIVAVVIAVAVISFLLSRRSLSGREPSLTEEEKSILDEIRRRGGRAYQSEIVRSLDLPKTTVWRRLRRLKSRGYIDIIKTDKGNLAVLRRR